ncbi:MAG: hypothetical protein OCD01_17755 [Fibrobacterales bacterium]
MRILALLLLLGTLSYGQISYYGMTGYHYTPNALTPENSKFGFLVGSKQTNLEQVNMIFHHLAGYGVISFLGNPLEISLSNTPGFVQNRPGNDPHEQKKGYGSRRTMIPLPSLKYGFHNKGPWAVAGGVNYNYGLYTVATFHHRFPILSPEVSAGISFAISKAYIMGGIKLQAADFSGNPLPLSFTVEGASGGSTELLGEVDEFFIALGFQTEITNNISISGNYRKDPSTYMVINKDEPDLAIEKESQNIGGLFALSITFTHKNL